METWAQRIADAREVVIDGVVVKSNRKMTRTLELPTPFDPIADIQEFHEHFGLAYDGKPRALPHELADFRQKFMAEELREYGEHASAAASELAMPSELRDQASYAYHLEHMLDALVDEVYVVLGTAYLHGFDFHEAWRRVHAANMKKVRKISASGDTMDSGRAPQFDIVKPAGWEPPSHIDLVEDHDLRSA